jgi:hypothetical protein
MTWTYAPELRLTVPLYEVRYLVGDTDTNFQLLSDEDLEYHLTKSSNNVHKAAWQAAEELVTIYAKRADISVGPIRILNDQRFQHFKDLADRLKKAYLTPGGGKLAGMSAGAMVNPDALGCTKLGPREGEWRQCLRETDHC